MKKIMDKPVNSKKMKIGTRNAIDYFLFLVIPLSLYLIFFIIPNVTSYVYSLFDYDGFGHFKFIGLQNFGNLFADRKFLIAVQNTVIYALTAIIGQNSLALIFAMLLYKASAINNFFRTLFYMPAILSSIAIGFIWGFILDPTIGIINTAFHSVGLHSFALNWLGERPLVMFSISFVHIWQAVGGATIIFISGLIGIPAELYECAKIEGAGRWQTFKAITFPLLMPVTVINIVLTTIGCFKSFDYVYVLTGGGGDGSSNVIATWLFKTGFQFTNVGYASSMAVVLSIIVTLIAFAQLRIYRDEN
ncbi:MAG: sugar ABC transporter permease [Oscillospiraceae bacterium]|nr:sugar ABC transporter permease [Oscillospiraceae bacterium]